MKSIHKTAPALLSAVAALLLAGCSAEPNAADVQNAVSQAAAANPALRIMSDLGAALTGDATQPAIEVEKGNCVSAQGASGYVCDVRITMTAAGQKHTGAWGKGRFFKTDAGWQYDPGA